MLASLLGRSPLPVRAALAVPALVAALVAGSIAFGSGCATLRQVAALRLVDFDLQNVTDAYLAGVRVDDKRSYSDLRMLDLERLAAAVAAGKVPLRMTVHVRGLNPKTNNVTARLTRLDWTLLLQDRETVSGRIDQEYRFEPGVPTDVPVSIQLDLLEFFSGRAQDLFDLALAVVGIGQPTDITLRARPTISTPIGPMRYPGDITIARKTVGG